MYEITSNCCDADVDVEEDYHRRCDITCRVCGATEHLHKFRIFEAPLPLPLYAKGETDA